MSEDDVVEVELLKQELKNLKIEDSRIQQVVERVQIENKSTYEISVLVYDPTIISELEEPHY